MEFEGWPNSTSPSSVIFVTDGHETSLLRATIILFHHVRNVNSSTVMKHTHNKFPRGTICQADETQPVRIWKWHSSSSRWRQMVNSCESDNRPSRSVKWGKFLKQFRNYQLLTIDCGRRSSLVRSTSFIMHISPHSLDTTSSSSSSSRGNESRRIQSRKQITVLHYRKKLHAFPVSTAHHCTARRQCSSQIRSSRLSRWCYWRYTSKTYSYTHSQLRHQTEVSA